MDKQLFWAGSSRTDLKAFPATARQAAGYQLRRVQRRFEPDDWKPMPAVGLGVKEIRIHTGREYRVLYVAKFTEGIYVLHAFEKKTWKTPGRELDVAKHRLRDIIRRRVTSKTK